MGKQHIIELNGQRYDALTGAIVTSQPIPAKKTTHKPALTGRSMDGFARAPRATLPHHQPEKSKTLMRTVVSKPKHVAPAHPTAKSSAQPKPLNANASHKQQKVVPKSPLISRFGTGVTTATQAATTPKTTSSHTATVAPAMPQNQDHLSKAIANATSHKQPKPRKARLHHRVARKLRVSPRLVSGASFAVAFLLIAGFFTYQNIPGLTMRLAASRSGVQGSLPGYQPAGFRLNGNIAYQPGQIIINYKSNSDNRNFKVSQTASQWDSQSLLENYVAQNRRDYQTVQDKGKTVYLYDGSNATWVDGGIWYRIEGESELNSDQLLSIASSL